MRYLMFFAFLLLSFISHAADTRFEEGVDAYQNNSYQQAFAIFLPLAQAGNVDDLSTENRTEKLSNISKRFEVSGRHLIIS